MYNSGGDIFIHAQVAYKLAVVHRIPGIYDVSIVSKTLKVVTCGYDDYIVTVLFKAPC